MDTSRPKILRLPQVIKRVGVQRSTIYEWMTKGKFPKPVPLGGKAVGWLDYEIDTWISEKISKREEL